MSNPIDEFYGNRLRLRVCGLCVQHDQLLLIHHALLPGGELWMPPGGGVEFGESVTDALKREFLEETGLIIEVEELLFTCEFMQTPLHAVELFFKVKPVGGVLSTGHDPELEEPIIKEARFVPWTELARWQPERLHGIFKKVSSPPQIMGLSGYFKL